jgi:hypothetical protein
LPGSGAPWGIDLVGLVAGPRSLLGMEPSPIRDNGPYPSSAAARAQFDAVAFGVPGDPAAASGLVLGEALMMAGVQPSDFERGVLVDLGRLDPATVQVIAGWVVRGHLAGVKGRRPERV